MEKKTKVIKNIIIVVMMAVVGLVLVGQIRSIKQEEKEAEEARTMHLESLQLQIEDMEKELKSVQADYDENSKMYEDMLNSLAENNSSFYDTLKTYHDSIDSVKETAGLTDVSGRGVVVTLSDSAGELVHDTTLLEIVSRLKLSGATAISVNDERVLAMSEFICVGPAVKVNDTKLFAPFEIKAVGDQELLEKAVKKSNAMTNTNININISVTKEDEITVPAYNKAYQNSIDRLKNVEG